MQTQKRRFDSDPDPKFFAFLVNSSVSQTNISGREKMAWEANITIEGYEAAKANLYEMKRDKVEIIFAEQKAEDSEDWDTAYESALKQAQNLDEHILFSDVWDFAENQNTADNGGFDFWLCPYGCHTAPVS
jgi:hypothetical protein